MQPLKILYFLMLISTVCALTTMMGTTKGSRLRFSIKKHDVIQQSHHYPIHHNNNISEDIIHELPTKSDLLKYVKSMEQIVEFCFKNKNEIDLNFAFGLFLMNVNLKTVLKHQQMHLPQRMVQSLRAIVIKNTGLLYFFRSMVKNDTDPRNKNLIAISDLFSNETLWLERIESYNATFDALNYKSIRKRRLEDIYKTWKDYEKYIFDYENRVPSPKQSDICVSALNKRHFDENQLVLKCKLPHECYTIIRNGSNVGYALTHRIMFMLLARYGLGCSVFSPAEDKVIVDNLCSAAFEEAEYIAANQYKVLDLLLEQIIFCSLEGHKEFLNRSWFEQALQQQTSFGCFRGSGQLPKYFDCAPRSWKIARPFDKQRMQCGLCHTHLTGSAAAALSTIVKAGFSSYQERESICP